MLQAEVSNGIHNNWVSVCPVEELIDNIGLCVLIDGIQIAIFKLSEEEGLFAINNYDPFSKANVLSRGVVGDINGEPVVASPIYKQHFSLRTGQCIEDEEVKIDCYTIRFEGDSVQISKSW